MLVDIIYIKKNDKDPNSKDLIKIVYEHDSGKENGILDVSFSVDYIAKKIVDLYDTFKEPIVLSASKFLSPAFYKSICEQIKNLQKSKSKLV